jgi:hypothetical protein
MEDEDRRGDFRKSLRRRNVLFFLGLLIVVLVGFMVYAAVSIGRSKGEDGGDGGSSSNGRVNYEVVYEGEAGRTALEVLTARWTVGFDDGVVKVIGGREALDGQKWVFYVNGEVSRVMAGNYVASGGEIFEWKLEEVGQ